MRDLSTTLTVAQQAQSATPLIKITLSHSGDDDIVLREDRILDINHTEEPYSQKADLLLDNSDGYFTDKALQGWGAVFGYGFLTKVGEEYLACAPLWVMAPTFSSAPGKLTCSLSLIGIPNLMAQDQASAAYQPASDDTNAAKTLIDAIAGATLSLLQSLHGL